MTALYITLGVLLFVLLLLVFVLSIKLRFKAVYEEKLSVVLSVLFLRFTLVPKPEKKKKKKKKAKKTASGEEKPQQQKKKESLLKRYYEKNGLDGLLSIISDVANLAYSTIKGLLEHIVIEKFDVDITICGEDAADTALSYGKTCGVFYSAVSAILSIAKCEDYNLNVTPDFDENHETKVSCETVFYIRTVYVVRYLLIALLELLKLKYKR